MAYGWENFAGNVVGAYQGAYDRAFRAKERDEDQEARAEQRRIENQRQAAQDKIASEDREIKMAKDYGVVGAKPGSPKKDEFLRYVAQQELASDFRSEQKDKSAERLSRTNERNAHADYYKEALSGKKRTGALSDAQKMAGYDKYLKNYSEKENEGKGWLWDTKMPADDTARRDRILKQRNDLLDPPAAADREGEASAFYADLLKKGVDKAAARAQAKSKYPEVVFR